MEQFNLEKYLENPSRKVVTRKGYPVRILCTDRNLPTEEIVGLIMNDDGTEEIYSWNKQGKRFSLSDESSMRDLFFAPEKHEGWINIFNAGDENVGKIIFKSKEKAEEIGKFSQNYVATIRIEWEE